MGFGVGTGNVDKNDIFKAVLVNEGGRVSWSKIEAINTGPSPRKVMAAATVANGDLFIQGGCCWVDGSNKAQQDTWKLKFAENSNEWEQLQDGPEPKLGHSADIVGPLVVFIGGEEG